MVCEEERQSQVIGIQGKGGADMKQKKILAGILLGAMMAISLCPAAPVYGAEKRNINNDKLIDVSENALQFGGLWESVDTKQKKLRIAAVINKQGAKEAMKKAAEGWKTGDKYIDVDLTKYNIPESEMKNLYVTFLNENAGLFYLGQTLVLQDVNRSTRLVEKISMSTDPEVTDEMREAFDAAVQGILAGVETDWTDLQKALYIHDYLVTHVEYDTTLQGYDAYDAIVGGAAVCQGYTLAYSHLLGKLGITCQTVSSDSMNHAWNLVTLSSMNGKRFFVDCTYDDPTGLYTDYCSHAYFMCGKTEFPDHKGTDWTSEETNIYQNNPTADDLNGALWRDTVSRIPMIGNSGLYISKENGEVKLYNFSRNTMGKAIAKLEYWPSTESRYFTRYFSSADRYGTNYVFSDSKALYLVSSSGTGFRKIEEEQPDGYYFGLNAEDEYLEYSIYGNPQSSSFVRKGRLYMDGIATKGESGQISSAVTSNGTTNGTTGGASSGTTNGTTNGTTGGASTNGSTSNGSAASGSTSSEGTGTSGSSAQGAGTGSSAGGSFNSGKGAGTDETPLDILSLVSQDAEEDAEKMEPQSVSLLDDIDAVENEKGVIKSLKSGAKKKLTVKMPSVQYTGYQIRYKQSGGSFRSKKTTKSSYTISGLSSKKNYVVQVRPYWNHDGISYYGIWSASKAVRVK